MNRKELKRKKKEFKTHYKKVFFEYLEKLPKTFTEKLKNRLAKLYLHSETYRLIVIDYLFWSLAIALYGIDNKYL